MKIQYALITVTTALMLYSAVRFDHLVRQDFFAGLSGDAAALERGMKKTEETLKENPNHAEALVWHGAGLFYLSGKTRDMAQFGKGMAEMQRAVELEPKNIGVRVPRAAVLASAAKFMPPQMSKSMYDAVLDDYTTVYQMQEKQLDQLGTHPKGELLFGLADTYSRIGNTDKADFYFKLLAEKLPNTAYAKRSAKWFETRQPLPPGESMCLGCHTGK